ncbi:MAG: hypothetical protein IKS17_08310 [Firmicutes bacterium]|nr:hypothetical protein [Bacillota bacterium]
MQIYIIVFMVMCAACFAIWHGINNSTEKSGLFHAFVFVLLVMGIICHAPLALEYILNEPSFHSRFCNTLYYAIKDNPVFCVFDIPVFIGAWIPAVYLIVPALAVILLKLRSLKLKDKIVVVILTVLYVSSAYAAVRQVTSYFCQ